MRRNVWVALKWAAQILIRVITIILVKREPGLDQDGEEGA
jgi:hypothetical protein